MTATQVFARLLGECLRMPGRLAALVASMLVLSATQLGLTWLAKLWSEALLGERGGGAVFGLLAVAALVTAAMAAALFLSRRLLADVNLEIVARLREQAQARLLAAEVGALGERRAGDLVSRILNDAAAVSGFAEAVLKRVVGEGFLLLGAVSMMLFLEWRLALLTFLVALPLAAIVSPVGRAIRRRGAAAQAELGGLTAMLGEQLHGITTIKGFQAEDFERERFAGQDGRFRFEALRAETWSASLMGGVWLVTGLGMLAVLGYGSRLVIDGAITAGGLLSFTLYAIQTIEPLRRMSEVHAQLQRTLASAARVYEIVDFPRVERDGDRELPVPVRGEIRLEGVRFGYQPDRPVLEDVSFTVGSRETLAIVSASGGGKTTVARLLARFADPLHGRMLLDGIDLREIRRSSLRRAVCVVEQDPFIFAGSVADNVRYGSWRASRRTVEEAAARAGLDELVRPGGLDARLQEGGRDLSGGQKQRIALARAIVRDPAVLVLDEATSALDSDIEGRIFAGVDAWLAERTVLVMAHRLSTVRRFPRVLVLDGGRLVADGDVGRLSETCPAFAQLFADQMAPVEGEASHAQYEGDAPLVGGVKPSR